MIVSGQTGAGKTHFVLELIKNQAVLHDKPFERIILSYSMTQPAYLRLQSQIQNLELVSGFPENLETNGENTLLILDDQMLELGDDKRLANQFTKVRHLNISTIFILQNPFHRSKYMVTVNRNCHYFVLFPNCRDRSMVRTLGLQVFPGKKDFLISAFEQATKKNFGYLFLDLTPNIDERLRVREGVLPDEQMFVYLPK